MKPSSIGIGCSHHSVPSVSKTAIRSAGGTKSGLPGLVTASTNPLMASRAAVGFHDGSTAGDPGVEKPRLPPMRPLGMESGGWALKMGERARTEVLDHSSRRAW